jgi:predicted PurR-regulated permease PerM
LIAMFIILIVVLAISGTIATPLALQGTHFIQDLPAITKSVVNNPTISGLTAKFDIGTKLTELSTNASAIILGSGTSLYLFFNNVVSFVTSFAVVLVMSFFLLIEGPELWEGAVKIMKEEYRPRAIITGNKIVQSVSGFVSGNIFISLIAGTVTLVIALVLGIPYAFALAALVALFDFVPLIGTAIATIVVGLVALAQSVHAAIIIVVLLLLYQFIESHFIQTAVYSRSIKLSPLLIIVATVVGAELGGVIGILLAIPSAAIVQIILLEVFSKQKKAHISNS